MMNRYLQYLIDLVDGEEDYSNLLRQLFSIEFYAIVPNDDNRIADGLNLREIFFDEEGLKQPPESFLDLPCSMLEMMIGVSFRLEYDSVDSYWERPMEEWFWVLIDNLELGDYSDYGPYDEEAVANICDIFLRRGYRRNGKGGLFPLKYAKKDQRLVEIWYQMSAYILEQFPL